MNNYLNQVYLSSFESFGHFVYVDIWRGTFDTEDFDKDLAVGPGFWHVASVECNFVRHH